MIWLQNFTICILCVCLSGLIAYAQPVDLSPDDFRASGHTQLIGDKCYQMTSDINWSAGGVWYKSPIRLENFFEMDLEILFGCKDSEGADGVVFIFSPFNEITGRPGEGMGFAGLYPSLGIEVDTWQNFHLSDPREDHIAILKDGYVDHYGNLAGPNMIENVEDCKTHGFTITWDPNVNKLAVSLDGNKVIEYSGDIQNEVFKGYDELFWGITAATGKYNNRHELCFKKIEISPPLDKISFTPSKITQLEANQITSIENLLFDSGSASVSESSERELFKILNLMKFHPEMSLDIFGHTDNVGSEETNQRISQLRAQAIADFLISKGINEKRINVQGLGEAYPKSTNRTAEGRKKNRRIDIKLYKPRT